jgi:protein-disulfide isomerase
MTPQSVREGARDVGQVTDFDAKYASAMESVKSDIALGRELEIKGTPTFFINGIRIDSMMAPQFFDQAIAYELKQAK